MRKIQYFSVFFALIASVIVMTACPARAAVQSRIVSAISNSERTPVSGEIHPLAKAQYNRGSVDAGMQMQGLTINFKPTAAQEAALTALLQAQQNPTSPEYHKWLTPVQFGQEFGMSQQDIAKVSAWLQAQGFTVDSVAPSMNSIHFSGTAAQVEAAFQTQLDNFVVDGETHFANTANPSVPTAFAGTVLSVRGLNNFRPQAHVRASSNTVPVSNPHYTNTGSSGTSYYLAPDDFTTIYDVKALYNAGYDGTGESIAIVGQSAVYQQDITDFRSSFGLSASNLPTMVLVPNSGASTVVSGDLSESELDLEWSGAVARNASIYFIYTGNNSNYSVFDSIQYAIQTYTVNGAVVPIISSSYGSCEANYAVSDFATLESWFKQANSQGQTVISASGDSGAADCDYHATSATQGLEVDYPASSQYVTGLGGTEFNEGSNASAYWSSNNNSSSGSALSYIPEQAWDDTPTAAAATLYKGLSAGGGGASKQFSKPSWQAGAPNIPADGMRDVPDIALSASANHDGYLTCIDNGCSGSSSYSVYGGTSVAAPTFAGILALIEQKLGSPQGNINPTLYAAASNASTYASAFHDVTVGSNKVPCTSGSTDCPSGTSSIGFNAVTGYDQATGLGSVNAFNLASAFVGAAAKGATTLALVAAPSSAQVGSTVTLTATVAASSGSTVPTGTVIFYADGSQIGSAVALTGTGMAAATTTFSTGGTHVVSAVYSGDTNFDASTGSGPVTATVSGGAATTTTLSVNPNSIALGSSVVMNATVASASSGTLTGTVQFYVGGTAIGGPVMVSSTATTPAAGTASLSVSAAATAGFSEGTNSITAMYQGDSNFDASTAAAVPLTITSPSITVTAANMTITSGAANKSGTSTITVNSGGGYSGTVGLTTASSTLNGCYTLGASSLNVSAGGSANTIITIYTAGSAACANTSAVKAGTVRMLRARASTGRLLPGGSWALGGGATMLASLFFLGFGGARKRKWPMLLCLLFLSVLATGLGCGGGSSPASGGGGTSPGTYQVTVTATDSSNSAITASTTFTVTIQ
jgi:subtilase family serine protease